MAVGRKCQAGPSAHLGGLRRGVGTEEVLEGDAGVVSGAGCEQGGGVRGGVWAGAGGGGRRRLTRGCLGQAAGHPLQRRLQGLAGSAVGRGARGGLRADLRGDGVVGAWRRWGTLAGHTPEAAAPLTWKQMLASESRCLSSASTFCRRAWSRRWGLSWWLSRAPTCARSMEPSRIMDSAGSSKGMR